MHPRMLTSTISAFAVDLLGRPLHRRCPGCHLPPGDHQGHPVQEQVLSCRGRAETCQSEERASSCDVFVCPRLVPLSIPRLSSRLLTAALFCCLNPELCVFLYRAQLCMFFFHRGDLSYYRLLQGFLVSFYALGSW